MKILIIDDEVAALTKMKVLLMPYGDCTLCSDAAQAMHSCQKAIVEGSPFQLITIDIQLGDEDGNDLLEKIDQLEQATQTPPAKKIMVTAMGTAENLVMAHSRGCDAFLVKPVKRDALEHKLSLLGCAKKNEGILR